MPFPGLWQHLGFQGARNSNLIESFLLDDEPGPLWHGRAGREKHNCATARRSTQAIFSAQWN
jgi:hypothetical protein